MAAAIVIVTLVSVSVSRGAAAPHSIDVTTYDYGTARTGDDPQGGAISHLAAAASWTATLGGAVYGQPLVDGGRVYVGTENDTLYALSLTTGRVLWHEQLGTAVSTSVIDQATGLRTGCGDIDPLGITGTPVIDAATGVIYVAEETMVGATKWQDIRHDLVAVSLSTHAVLWTRDIDPAQGRTTDGYTIAAEQQRPALTLANKTVYVEFGGLAGDCGLYHGMVVGVPASGRGATDLFQVPSHTEGAIWATSGALVAPDGDLYVASGNGSSTTSFDGGDALFQLSPTLAVLSQWAPTNWAQLTAHDWDLGSAGPVFIPGTSDIFIAGKPEGGSTGTVGYVVPDSHLGTGPGAPLFSGTVCKDLTQDGGDFGANATAVITVGGVRTTYVFTACRSATEAVVVHPGASPTFTQAWSPSTGTPDGPPVYAGGLVWALDWQHAGLFAMRPTTGHVVFERATLTLPHFAAPMVADGYVLVPTRTGVEAFATS